MSTIPAGAPKARSLEGTDEVERAGEALVVSQDGRPVTEGVPVAGAARRPLFGRARHSVVSAASDTFLPAPELWEALHR